MPKVARAFLGLLIALGGCDGGNPVSPTAAPPQRPVRPQDPRFEDAFWGQLVYDRYEDSAAGLSSISWVLDAPMNLYIRTTDELGRRALFGNGLAQMIDAAPRLGRELSGRNIIGRVESGPMDPGERLGWILLTPETSLESDACGQAYIGANPGRIWISTDYYGHCLDLEVFAHELGHALGFWHVDPDVYTRAVMRPGGWFADRGQYRYSDREVYYARLAYEVGSHAPYCGWPYGSACGSGQSSGSSRPAVRPPVIVD